MGIRTILSNMKYEHREKMKQRKAYDEAELHEIKQERAAMKTRKELRENKWAAIKERFEGSPIGRVSKGVKKMQKSMKGSKKATASGKGFSVGKGFGSGINPAFSLGKSKPEKKKEKTITIKIKQ